MGKQTIKVGVYCQDNGDGSNGTTLYPTLADAKQAQAERNQWETPEDIPDDYDLCYYEHGSVQEDTLQVEVHADGSVTLASSYYVEGGA